MKIKILIMVLSVIVLLSGAFTVLAASVVPETRPGNDQNDQDEIVPDGCIYYKFDDFQQEGVFTVRFDQQGNVDPDGPLFFTVTIGKLGDNEYTQVISWSSNFPVYAVIVKGGPAYNLYKYPPGTTSDTDLVSPDNESGKPADVSHVSLIFCPSDVPPQPPEPDKCCIISIILLVIVLILLFVLLFITIKTLCLLKRCCYAYKPSPCDWYKKGKCREDKTE